jgi:hypothetical protein
MLRRRGSGVAGKRAALIGPKPRRAHVSAAQGTPKLTAAKKNEPDLLAAVERKLDDGTYDRALAELEAQIEQAAAALRRAYEAMKAENTLRS